MVWLFLYAAQVDPKVVEPAVDTITQTIIGSLLIISWALAILAIVQLIRVQNARVTDQKAMSKASQDLSTQMVKAFEEMKQALIGLKEAEEKGQKVNEATQQAMTNMASRFDMLVFSIGGKRFTPQSVAPPTKEPESR